MTMTILNGYLHTLLETYVANKSMSAVFVSSAIVVFAQVVVTPHAIWAITKLIACHSEALAINANLWMFAEG